MFLRKANNEDMDLFFEWANDDACRENAFSQDKIEYIDHIQWYSNKLNSDSCDLYVYYDQIKDDFEPIGQIRLDYKNNIAYIDYSIDRLYRNQGHGERILELMEKEVRHDKKKVKALCAQVKYENIASQKKFEQLSYRKQEKKDYILYLKDICE